jgi:hypothetical protein
MPELRSTHRPYSVVHATYLVALSAITAATVALEGQAADGDAKWLDVMDALTNTLETATEAYSKFWCAAGYDRGHEDTGAGSPVEEWKRRREKRNDTVQ